VSKIFNILKINNQKYSCSKWCFRLRCCRRMMIHCSCRVYLSQMKMKSDCMMYEEHCWVLFLCSYKQSRMKSCSEASHHQQNCCLHCNSCFDKSCWTQICWKLLQGETPCCCWSTSSKGQWLNWIAK